MDEERPSNKEINDIDSPARPTSVDSFENARGAVEEGDVAHVSGYLSKSSADEARVEIDEKANLHAAMTGQVGGISKPLPAELDPHLCCSTGETSTDLFSAERNEHTEARSLLHCYGAPPPSPAANDEMTPPGGKSNATGEKSRKPGRLIFGRKPWGGDSTSLGMGSTGTPMKDRRTPRKGRGKRPGFSPSSVASETLSVTPGGQCTPWLNDPLQEGWVLCTDSDGFRYYWNEALQETRWTDASGNLPAVLPEPSPANSAYPFGFTADGLPSPAHFNFEKQSWADSDAAWAFALDLVPESPVHSPGWPSPRGAHGGFMHLPPPSPKLRPPPTPGYSWIPDVTASHDPENLVRGISWSEAETTACARPAESISGYKAGHTRCGGSNDVSARVEAVEDGGTCVVISSSGSSENSVDTSSDTSGIADISVDTSGSADTSVDTNADTSSGGTLERTLERTLNRTVDSTLDSTFDSALDCSDNIDTNSLESNFDRTVDRTMDSTLDSTLDNTLNNDIDTSGLDNARVRTFFESRGATEVSMTHRNLHNGYGPFLAVDATTSRSVGQSSASSTPTESPRRPAAQGTRDLVGTDVVAIFATRVMPPMPQRTFRSFSFPSPFSAAAVAALARPSKVDSAAPFEERQHRQHRSHAAAEISVPCAPSVGGPIQPWGDIWTDAARLARYAPTALLRQEEPEDGMTSGRASSVVPNALQRQPQQQQTAPENLTLLSAPTTGRNGAN